MGLVVEDKHVKSAQGALEAAARMWRTLILGPNIYGNAPINTV